MKTKPIKPGVFILLFFLIITVFPAFSQDNSARINEIRKMYGEAIQIENAGDSSGCQAGSKTVYEGFDETSEKLSYKHSCKGCTYTGGYKIFTGEFCGYEWFNKTILYFKDDKLFFIFSDGGAESCAWEYRIYYDKDGNAIKILDKSNDCTGEEPDKSKEIVDPLEKKRILDEVNNDYNSILEMLK